MSLIDTSAYVVVLIGVVGLLTSIYYFVNFQMAVIAGLGLIIMENAEQ